MKIDLTSNIEERKNKFYSLTTFAELADLLEVEAGYLNFVLYRIPLEKRYTQFTIPKKTKGEVRVISNPIPPIKILQRKLYQVLEHVYQPRASAYGFIKGKNILQNAKAHRKKTKLKYVFNIDIEDFFPSIRFVRVRGLFKKQPYNLPHNVAQWLAQICCYENGLPQGAPTSPIIANMLCNKLDSQLQRLAQKHRCTYTRYADDITFSTSMPRFPTGLALKENGQEVLGEELEAILKENKFAVNAGKIRLQTNLRRQEITGLTVNRFPNVRREYVREIRAMLHDWGNGYEEASRRYFEKRSFKYRYPNKSDLTFKSVVRGKIEFLGMIRGKDDAIYIRFMKRLAELDESVKFEEVHKAMQPIKIFLNYARQDEDKVKELYFKLQTAGYEPWMDTVNLYGGEKWLHAITQAIADTDLFIMVLSKHSEKKRGILQKEIKLALDKWEEKLEDDIFIIPLRLEDCSVVNSQIAELQWIDYFKNNGWNRLTQSIQESIRRAAE